ncbi:MAG: hypothetical protein PHH85_03525 [Candidatus Methanoperedens sp.]|nr:hypothetical protein [Candidatus Methanoperedens sp.]
MSKNDICGEEGYKSPEQIANDMAAAALFELQQQQAAATQAAEQLRLKTAMLQSQTAVWSDPNTYKTEVAETTQEIRAYNADVAAFLATAPGQSGTDNALLGKPAAQSQPATPATTGSDKSDPGKAIIIAVGLAAVIAAFAIAGGRK